MGTHTSKHIRVGALILLTLVLIPTAGLCVLHGNGPQYVPNQVLVTLAPGKSEAVLSSMLSQYGLTVVKRPTYSHTYVLQVPGTGTPVDSFLNTFKGPIMRANPAVQYMNRNYYLYPSVEPNDEFYRPAIQDPTGQFLVGQWQLWPNSHIFAPEGWDLEKGGITTIVAVVDTGVRDRNGYNDSGKLVRIVHPDLEGRVLFGIDLADQDDYPILDPSPSENPKFGDATHGTHVAGIIAAQGNNWIGISGLCWDNVWILPVKVFHDTGVGTVDLEIEAIYYCMAWWATYMPTNERVGVSVINMSLGHYGRIEEEEAAIKQAVGRGIVVVCAAGNDWDLGAYPPTYPAAYPDAICVAATQYDDTVTSFSQRGAAVDIAAPGWDILSTVWFKSLASVDKEASDITPAPNTPSSIMATSSFPGTITPNANVFPQPSPMPTWPDKYGNTFEYMSGTSMASPHVAAAAALLMSHGVPAEDVKPLLYETATPKGIGRPNDAYGWGLLNVFGALKKATVDVSIESPGKGSVITTTRPRFRINLRHVDLNTLRVWIDGIDSTGDGIPDNQPTIGGPSPELTNWRDYVYTLDQKAGKQYLLFQYTVNPQLAVNGIHRIYVTGATSMTVDVPPPPPVDTGTFKVNPQSLGTGWRLFSVPFYFSQPMKPEQTMGNSGVLARWQYATNPVGEYAMYSFDGSRTDDEATFTPTSVYANGLVRPLDFTRGTPPAGLGYWLYLPTGSNVSIPDGFGDSMEQFPYVIGLYNGWNIVGDPFPFPVDWSNVMVEYAGERISAEDAAARGWISSAIFRYDNVYGRYTWRDVASAVLVPWEGEWVRVKVKTPDLTPATIPAWSDEFSDGVIDQTDPEPQWFVGNTNGTVLENGGMMKLTGTVGTASYMYIADKAFPIYSDFAIDARLILTNSTPTMAAGPANAELRFRTSDTGMGYSVAFRASDTPSTISLRRTDTNQVIQSKQVTRSLTSGSGFYVSVTAIGTHLKVKVGTFPGRGDVADWELEDSSFSGPGSFWLINDGMRDCWWDYFRYRPVPVRPTDVKLIVAPNPYTGPVQ